MFTDRFIKVPIKIYSTREESLSGKEACECETIGLQLRLNPYKIEEYYPCIPGELEFSKENVTCTRVIMESGEAHLIYLNIKEFENLLNPTESGNS